MLNRRNNQNFLNHTHYVPLYHYLTFTAMAALIVGATYNLFTGDQENVLINTLFLLLVLTVISVSFHNRSFALKVQDRAIRAEENLRYYMLTGRRIDQNITIYQLIALRFAEDDEFVKLVEETVKENLTPRQIKKRITNWRPDHYRA
jgi:Family of unknown function (DUF6526)